MENLVLITVKEFKRDPFSVMDACVKICTFTDNDTVIVIPGEENTYKEIARVKCSCGGFCFEYNMPLIQKFNITIDPKKAKIKAAITEAFDKVELLTGSMKPSVLKSKLDQAVELIAEKLGHEI